MTASRHLSFLRRLTGCALFGCSLICGFAESAVRENTPRPGRAPAAVSENIGSVAETTPDDWLGTAHLRFGEGMSLGFLATLGARYDDNIFLTSTDEETDTVITATPRLEFRFGRDAHFQGMVGFEENFTRYARKSAPNANLAAGNASLSYQGAAVTAATSVDFRQNYQNTQELAGQNQKEVYRSDVLNIHANAETILTAKTSVSVGASLSRTEYKTAGLVGSENLTLPLKFYLDVTPKVSLSAGFSYRKVSAPGSATDGRDVDFNVGARGTFTPKLSGQVSVGYRTRTVGDQPKESIFIFDGALDYELTPKSSASLTLSRDFGIGTQGASLQTTNYGFSLATAPTPQWQFGSGLNYRRVTYGAVLFPSQSGPPVPAPERNDDFWEASLFASYLPTTSLSTSLKYIISDNRSTQALAEYSSNVLNFTVGWKY